MEIMVLLIQFCYFVFWGKSYVGAFFCCFFVFFTFYEWHHICYGKHVVLNLLRVSLFDSVLTHGWPEYFGILVNFINIFGMNCSENNCLYFGILQTRLYSFESCLKQNPMKKLWHLQDLQAIFFVRTRPTTNIASTIILLKVNAEHAFQSLPSSLKFKDQ